MEVREVGKSESLLHFHILYFCEVTGADGPGFAESVSLLYNSNLFLAMCSRGF